MLKRQAPTDTEDEIPLKRLKDVGSQKKGNAVFDRRNASHETGCKVLIPRNIKTVYKEVQPLVTDAHIDKGTQFVRYSNQDGAKIFRYFVPTTFYTMERIVAAGINSNSYQIVHNYLHGYENCRDDITSENLVQYLEDGKLKLIELKKFSSGASAMISRRSNKNKNNEKNKKEKSYFPEQLATRKRGVIILKCAMDFSKQNNTLHLITLNLFENYFYEGGETILTFDIEHTNNMDSLKAIFQKDLGIKRVLAAFLVVNRDPLTFTKKQLRDIRPDELYVDILDKKSFPLKSAN